MALKKVRSIGDKARSVGGGAGSVGDKGGVPALAKSDLELGCKLSLTCSLKCSISSSNSDVIDTS